MKDNKSAANIYCLLLTINLVYMKNHRIGGTSKILINGPSTQNFLKRQTCAHLWSREKVSYTKERCSALISLISIDFSITAHCSRV